MPDQTARPLSHAASTSRPYNAAIEAILFDRFPSKAFVVVAEAIAKMSGDVTANPFAEKLSAEVQAHREKLLALPATDLNALYAQLQKKQEAHRISKAADDKAKKQTKAAAQEAAKFYNQPNAQADFAFWMKADYWTLEEALALLLGRNPKLVTFAAMKRELESGFALLMTPSQRPPLPQFVEQYQRLRLLAERAATENSETSNDPGPNPAVKGEQTNSQDVLSAPTGGTSKKWTPEKLRELATYRDQYGTQASAEKYGISAARVRQLLPKVSSELKKSAKSSPRGHWAGL